MTGLLVAFEGPDGVGKSTLACAVFDLLQPMRPRRVDVVLTSEPHNKPWIKDLRKEGAATLEAYEADRRKHWRSLVCDALMMGSVVLTDRYFLSTAVYQVERGIWTWEAILTRQRRQFAEPDLWVMCQSRDAAARLASREPPEEYSAEIERRYGVARHALGDRAIVVDCGDSTSLEHNASRVAWEIIKRQR